MLDERREVVVVIRQPLLDVVEPSREEERVDVPERLPILSRLIREVGSRESDMALAVGHRARARVAVRVGERQWCGSVAVRADLFRCCQSSAAALESAHSLGSGEASGPRAVKHLVEKRRDRWRLYWVTDSTHCTECIRHARSARKSGAPEG